MEKTAAKRSLNLFLDRGSPFKYVICIASIILFNEALIMLSLSLLPPMPTAAAIAIDSLSLVLLTAPALYLIFLRPLTVQIRLRREAEERLAHNEKYLRSIIEMEPECVKIVSDDGTLLDMNPAGLTMIEAEREQAIGRPLLQFVASEYHEGVRGFIANVCGGGRDSLEFEVVGLKGGRKRVESHGVPFPKGVREKCSMLSVTRDVTEQRKLEEQLRHAVKMEAVGTLSSGIAHDFNNILSAVLGYGEFLQDALDKEDPSRNYADQIIAAAKRGGALTESLLAFSRKQMLYHPRPVALNGILKAVEKLLSRVLGDDIELKTTFADADLVIMANSAQVEQVLINLATNARDAMPRGGALTINAGRVDIDADFVKFHGFGSPGPYARISVSDTGMGMDEKTRARIFEPYFTTKATGKGTGLGLSMAYGTVKQHGGYINVYSEPGIGSTFNIYLPIAEHLAPEEKLEPAPAPPRGGAETVLLAEDDASVRQLTKAVLQKFGYEVIEAADGDEAVRKFKEHGRRIKLLVFDVVMPKKSGREAYEEIKGLRADVKAVFMSGFLGEDVLKRFKAGEKMELIVKPVSQIELLRKVRDVLDG